MTNTGYTIDELMVVEMARRMRDGELVVQGISTPLVFAAFILAKLTHAPNLYFLYTVGNSLADLPGRVGISMIEKLTLDGCLKRVTMTEINCELAPYYRPREFMRPAQVDGRGNFNNTVIGPFFRPKVRLPGGAGIPDATNFNDHLNLYIPRHSPRVLVEKIDFRTGLGYGREGAGRRDRPVVEQGPNLILTDLCKFGFKEGRTRLLSLHPGVKEERVRRETGFFFDAPQSPPTTEPPSAEEVRLLREEIDPLGVRRLEFMTAQERLAALKEILEAEKNDG